MTLVYDHWKDEALKHKDKILENYKTRYHSYKSFIDDLRAQSIPEQNKTLDDLFCSYDAMRPDTGIFESVDKFLADPFVYLPIYENVRMWQEMKTEFPLSFLAHYNTWEKRETALLRGQNATIGASIVDNLSSIVGFDFFTGVDLKNSERMPSDFANLNIHNTIVNAAITEKVTDLKSHLLLGRRLPFTKLAFPFDETLFFPQVEELCRKNPEFFVLGTSFFEITMSDLIFVDGKHAYEMYLGMKEREYAPILFKDLTSGEHRVDVAVSQYMPAKEKYNVKLIQITHANASEPSDEVNRLMTDELKKQFEDELAEKMTDAREEYELFYYHIVAGDVKAKAEKNHKDRISNFTASNFFYALNHFYEPARNEYAKMCEAFTGPVSAVDYEALYLFYIDEYGKLDSEKCQKALENLILGDSAKSSPVLDKIISFFDNLSLDDYMFHSMEELFEKLNHYYPLYLKTQLLIKLSAHFPNGVQKRINQMKNRNQLHQCFYVFPIFYSCAVKLSNANGYSFENTKPLPADGDVTFEEIFSDQILVNFIIWLHDAPKDKVSEYAFPTELSALRFKELLSMTLFPISWLRDALPDEKDNWHDEDYIYLDGIPLSRFEEKQKNDLKSKKDAKNLEITERHNFQKQLTKSSSLGHHVLCLPAYSIGDDNQAKVRFIRIYSGIGIAPNDKARAHFSEKKSALLEQALDNRVKELEDIFNETIQQSAIKENKLITQKAQLLRESVLRDVETAEQMSESIRFEKEEYNAMKKEAAHYREVIAKIKDSEGKGLIGILKKNSKKEEDIAGYKKQLTELERKINEKKSQISYQERFIANAEASKQLVAIYKKRL